DRGPVVLDLDIISPAGDDTQSEYGVQSLTVHPDFATNGWIYIRYDKSLTAETDTPQSEVVLGPNFTASDPTTNVIERYVWNPAANDGDGALVFDQQIYAVTFNTRYHHGGPSRFGPDGMLYTVFGELRRQNFVTGHPGELLTMNVATGLIESLGVITRLNDDGSIPADNIFDPMTPGVPPLAAAWHAYGIRNSFGLAFDPATGSLWDTENGEFTFDEVNLIAPGFNSGWRRLMGPTDHPMQTGSTAALVNIPGSSYSEPEFTWLDTIGVTALHFAHGSYLGPAFDDLVLFGAFNHGFVWAMRLNAARDGFTFLSPDLQDLVDDRTNTQSDPVGTEAEELLFGRDFGGFQSGVIAIERGLDSRIYLLTGAGRLYRLERRCAADIDGDGAVGAADLAALLGGWGQPGPADLDGDGTVTASDLGGLLGAWGPCPQ
ncbi:MAG: PQQ-dependent sugar dehydrogenase, partial [Planctomycetota bacterium]|nr:PQQ-dependent sugar dehydrogenase [Planctomycetota bacterium]